MPRPASQPRNTRSGSLQGRRGRPTPDRVAAIDFAIRAAALEQFLDEGFEAASMDAIAAAAQVSKGTLYARYPAKEPLFRAVLESELEEWSRRASARDHLLTDEIEVRLRHHARTFADVFTWPEFQRIATLMDASAKVVPDLAREWDEYITERSVQFLRDDMAKAGGPGVDWEFYARLFLSAIAGWHRANRHGDAADVNGLVAFSDKMIEVMLIGIANGAPREGTTR